MLCVKLLCNVICEGFFSDGLPNITCAAFEAICTSRAPENGDSVRRIGNLRTRVGSWVLEPGEVALVQEVDEDLDFKLKNPNGDVSEWVDRSKFMYVKARKM